MNQAEAVCKCRWPDFWKRITCGVCGKPNPLLHAEPSEAAPETQQAAMTTHAELPLVIPDDLKDDYDKAESGEWYVQQYDDGVYWESYTCLVDLIERIGRLEQQLANARNDALEGTAMNGAELIAVERQRQIEQEGWTPEHDDCHRNAEMADAATAYIEESALITTHGAGLTGLPNDWPDDWDGKWWKPSPDPIRNLVKAGALVAAEIDRIQRRSLIDTPTARETK